MKCSLVQMNSISDKARNIEMARDLIEQAGVLSLREGAWKYIEPGKGPRIQTNTNTELGNDPDGQLYNLDQDPGETRNLVASEPERAARLRGKIQAIRAGQGQR